MYIKKPRNHQTSTRKSFNHMQFIEKFYNNPVAQREMFIQQKFPTGYICPQCGHTSYTWLEKRRVCQCKNCCNQTYLLASTVLQDSKLSFYQILTGIFFFVTSQSGISGTNLAIHMGVNVNTARLFLRKLREGCRTKNSTIFLENMIELDCGYLGGVDEGGKRGAGAKKQTIAVAIEFIQGTNKKSEPVNYPEKDDLH